MPDTPTTANGAAALTDWGVIRARGEDAASFLQGQLTQDMVSLGPDAWRLAGYCSAKGRLLASFLVCRPAADELLLACSADLLAPTLKRLSMFVLRAKCRLVDATAEYRVTGVVGDEAVAALGVAEAPSVGGVAMHGGGPLLRLPDAEGAMRCLWLAPQETVPASLPALEASHWRWLEVRSAVPRIVAATVEQFVPQMINLELVGGVSFSKGCYPGQEIVARSQYRGTLKRRMLAFDVAASAQPGQEVFHAGDPTQPAGMVVDAAPAPGPVGGSALLVEIKLSALDGQPIFLGAPDGPALRARPLPYTLPAAEAA